MDKYPKRLNTTDSASNILLHYAAKYGNVDVMRLLLAKDTYVDQQNDNQLTPLHLAVIAGKRNMAKLLIDQGARLDIESCHGTVPSMVAKLNLNEDWIPFLIDNGWDVNELDNKGNSMLHNIIDCAPDKILIKLLSKKADPNLQNSVGVTPFHLAMSNNRRDIVELMRKYGGHLNPVGTDGMTSLHRLSRFGKIEQMRLLLNYGVPVDVWSDQGMTALHVAIAYVKLSAVRFLQAQGARIDIPNDEGLTRLQVAVREGCLNETIALIRFKADINRADANGWTPLHFAVDQNNLLMVQQLIQRKADIDCQTKTSSTPLHLAGMNNHQAIAEYLISMGADTTRVNQAEFIAGDMCQKGVNSDFFLKETDDWAFEPEPLIAPNQAIDYNPFQHPVIQLSQEALKNDKENENEASQQVDRKRQKMS